MAKIFNLSERINSIVFIDDNHASYQDTRTHVFIIRTSIGIILKVTGPILLFINKKYVSGQEAKNFVCIVKLFSAIIIEVGGYEVTQQENKIKRGF